MGLFGFGKKKREREEAEAKAENREDEAAVDTEETAAPTDVADTYEGRGESYGPWDVDDENVPDYDEYLDMGSYYLPYLAGLQLRIKANRSTQEILGRDHQLRRVQPGDRGVRGRPRPWVCGTTCAPICLRPTRRHPNTRACSAPNSTCRSPSRGGKTVNTRIVGVDGPRWMLRGHLLRQGRER